MRLITVMGLLFVLFLGVVYGTLTATGNDRVDMTGKVVGLCNDNLQGNNNAVNSLLVEGAIYGGSENQNISVIIGKNTTIYHKYGNTLKSATINDLKPGQRLEIKFTGSVLQSYPPQTNASQITIIGWI